ncbi:MAG: phytoene desaturase [Bacteroidia bacterium]|nr:phytoene desaturase [Bacteroidia bacterium]
MDHKTAIIGSGFAGLSAACYLAANGHSVEVYEKNELLGGRARQFKTDNGYTFDMGPSWYWMPEIFDKFFSDFNKNTSDVLDLIKLDPAFTVIFKNEELKIPDHPDQLAALFESIEAGAGRKLHDFMDEAGQKYELGIKELMYKPSLSLFEFANYDLLKGFIKLDVFSSFSKHVRKYFKDPKLISIMEFPVLFLGAMPKDTPALYSLMNYAGLMRGTWYPIGGFGKVIEAMTDIARSLGVKFHVNSEVEEVKVQKNRANSLIVNGSAIQIDSVIATADYHHIEDRLLPEAYRNYDDNYWQNKTFAPSCLIYYLGVKKKLPALDHHNLFFDEDLNPHAEDIYIKKRWPSDPLFYVCCPSKSDKTVAPDNHENLFLLMPIAAGIRDDNETREKYFEIMIERLQEYCGENIVDSIDFKQSYCVEDFKADYNAYKGNAYGLANTLMQTGTFKPKMINKKIKNLFYAGQLTVPGPGVPPSIISGKIAADLLIKQTKKEKIEVSI